MKKVTLKDLNGKIIESYFVSNHPNNFPTDMENHTVEDVPSDKDWFDMTGGEATKSAWGYDDTDHPLNKHDEGQTYNVGKFDLKKGKAKGQIWSDLTESLLNKIKLEESKNQIKVKIDDTIPSDFVSPADQRFGSIYKVAGLGLTARLMDESTHENKTLLKMNRHDTVFYLEEGSLMKATDFEVSLYLEQNKYK